MITIGLLGYGEIGKALHTILAKKEGVDIRCWDKNADILPDQGQLDAMIKASNILFLCIPTWLMRSAIQGILPFLQPSTTIVVLSKGFEKETCTRVDGIVEHFTKDKFPVVYIGGPMIAEELMTGVKTSAVAASHTPEARSAVSALFENTPLAVFESDDLPGVLTAASLKNIYAIGLGMSDGLNLGANAHGVLLSQAVQEMIIAITAQGGQAATGISLAGLGDLAATAQSTNSTNYSTGVRLARGLDPLRGSEGMNTLPCIEAIFREHLPHMPFLQGIIDVILKKNDPKLIIPALLEKTASSLAK